MPKKKNSWWVWGGAAALLLVGALGFPVGAAGPGTGKRRRVNPGYFSRFYDISDVERSNTAEDLGLSNTPNNRQFENARTFAQTVLDPIATFIGEAPKVNSWFRSSAVNQAVGGSSGSDHLSGSAADVTFKDGNNNFLIVRAILAQNLPVDQIILYGGLGGKKYIHLGQDVNKSLDAQRRQILEKTTGGYASVSDEVVTAYFL
jgi:zinc D-Ala-D-Ala carboxypeptidase